MAFPTPLQAERITVIIGFIKVWDVIVISTDHKTQRFGMWKWLNVLSHKLERLKWGKKSFLKKNLVGTKNFPCKYFSFILTLLLMSSWKKTVNCRKKLAIGFKIVSQTKHMYKTDKRINRSTDKQTNKQTADRVAWLCVKRWCRAGQGKVENSLPAIKVRRPSCNTFGSDFNFLLQFYSIFFFMQYSMFSNQPPFTTIRK